MNLKTFLLRWGLQLVAAAILCGILLYSALASGAHPSNLLSSPSQNLPAVQTNTPLQGQSGD